MLGCRNETQIHKFPFGELSLFDREGTICFGNAFLVSQSHRQDHFTLPVGQTNRTHPLILESQISGDEVT